MKKILLLFVIVTLAGCKDKLELKPDSTLILPKTLKDFESMLENTDVMNREGALGFISADEYIIPTVENYKSVYSNVVRNAYIWNSDLLSGTQELEDWDMPYEQVFMCNNVLDYLSKKNEIADGDAKNRLKGWALFARAYAFYSLVSVFSKGYEPSTAVTDLGIPLKLTPAITDLLKRSSVEESYSRIIRDASESAELLQTNIVSNKRNRPSKVAAFALLARVYLNMRKYEQAESSVDKVLELFPKLLDYNTLTIKTTTSFTLNSEECIYYSYAPSYYSDVMYSTGALYSVKNELFDLYEADDLRKQVYFAKNANGNIAWKGNNSNGRTPFTGLASDEMYLIKAECLARRGLKEEALAKLNELVKTRYKTDSFHEITAETSKEALEKVFTERRKALIWRGIRWTDLKRYNLEGQNITLTRKLGDQLYSLEPNSPKYVMPILESEIQLSGIQQNIR